MNAAEFKLQRYGLGLSALGMAALCAVTENVVHEFERGDSTIPEKVASILYRLEEQLKMAAHEFVCEDISDINCNVFLMFNHNEDYQKYGVTGYSDVQLHNLYIYKIMDECRGIGVDYHVIEFDREDFEASQKKNPSLTVSDWMGEKFSSQ